MNLIKPPRLKKGDTVAVVTLSWGGPSVYPHRYAAGLRQLADTFDLRVVEMKHATADADWLYDHPEKRAEDWMEAVADPDIKAIVTSIGGDDTIRLLPYVDFDLIRNNPKIFMGFSDTTANHFMYLKAGVSSFYAPCVMVGFAENAGMHALTKDAVRKALFDPAPLGELRPSEEGWTNEFLAWQDPANQSVKRKMSPSAYRFLQGTKTVRGPLIGGCMEVLEMMKGTPLWPSPETFEGAVLFFETCGADVFPEKLSWWLRNYAASGIFENAAGVLFGRPGGDGLTEKDFDVYDETILRGLKEYGLTELPVVTRMDFGHTDPIAVLPYGATAQIDPAARTVTILDGAVV